MRCSVTRPDAQSLLYGDLSVGLPDPPAHVQVDPGPQDNTLLVTWRPVDTQPKPPSRAAVAAYLIYADGRKVLEVPSPSGTIGETLHQRLTQRPSRSGDHVLLRLSEFIDDPPLFITVRTRTREGAVSADSNVVRVPRSMTATNAFSPKHATAAAVTPVGRSRCCACVSLCRSFTHRCRVQGLAVFTSKTLGAAADASALSGGLLMVQPSPAQTQVRAGES